MQRTLYSDTSQLITTLKKFTKLSKILATWFDGQRNLMLMKIGGNKQLYNAQCPHLSTWQFF